MGSRRITMIAMGLLLGLAAISCTSNGDYSAKFLRYETLKDGTRVAVVTPLAPGSDPEQIAYTGIEDLRSGEVVIIRATGKGWDEPQWKPERQIVSRASEQ